MLGSNSKDAAGAMRRMMMKGQAGDGRMTTLGREEEMPPGLAKLTDVISSITSTVLAAISVQLLFADGHLIGYRADSR